MPNKMKFTGEVILYLISNLIIIINKNLLYLLYIYITNEQKYTEISYRFNQVCMRVYFRISNSLKVGNDKRNPF